MNLPVSSHIHSIFDNRANHGAFSGGGWLKANPLPSDKAIYGTFQEVTVKNQVSYPVDYVPAAWFSKLPLEDHPTGSRDFVPHTLISRRTDIREASRSLSIVFRSGSSEQPRSKATDGCYRNRESNIQWINHRHRGLVFSATNLPPRVYAWSYICLGISSFSW